MAVKPNADLLAPYVGLDQMSRQPGQGVGGRPPRFGESVTVSRLQEISRTKDKMLFTVKSDAPCSLPLGTRSFGVDHKVTKVTPTNQERPTRGRESGSAVRVVVHHAVPLIQAW